jgi:hypothetical protein
VRTRHLAVGAALWAAGYAVVYLVLIGRQGSSPAWWYVGLLAAGVASLAVGVAGSSLRPMLILGTVLLAMAALAGMASIGMLLIPGVAAGAMAAARQSWPSHPGRPAS